MQKKYLLLVASLLSIISLLLIRFGSSQSAATPTPFPTAVRMTYVIYSGNIIISLELFGRVTPLALAVVNFQMDGQVGDVMVMGKRVRDWLPISPLRYTR
jgi:hypothetical protein